MKISYSWEDAASMVGYSVRTLKQAAADGYLSVRYANSKAVIRHQDLEEWVDGLSAESPSSR
jgi:S-adenosylhomocysteine hydrolase